MTINECNIVLHDKDVNGLIQKFVPPTKKMSSLRAEINDGHVLITGRVTIGLSFNFQATLVLSHRGDEVIARLEKLSPMSGIMAQFKDKILYKIAEKADFIRHNAANDALEIRLNSVLGQAVETSNLNITKLSVAKDDLTIAVQGELSL